MVNHENDSTVENLCALVRALFCEVDISNVLSGEVVFDCISCERAARLAVKTQKLYEWCSELECQKRMEAISDGMWRRDGPAHPVAIPTPHAIADGLHPLLTL